MSNVMKWSRNTNRGFTLVELVVTTVIIAIIATVAAPSFSNMIDSRNLELSVNELVQTLQQGRSQAVTLRRNVVVNLDTTGANNSNTFYWKPSSDTIYKKTKKNGSDITKLNAVTFRLSGRLADNATISMIVCNATESKSREVEVDFMGNLSVKDEVTACA